MEVEQGQEEGVAQETNEETGISTGEEELSFEGMDDFDPDAAAALGEEELSKLIEGEVAVEKPKPGEEAAGDKAAEGAVSHPEMVEFSEKLSKLEKQVGDKETFIQRQANMIGELRRQLEQVVNTTQYQAPDNRNDPEMAEREREAFLQDPRGYLQRVRSRDDQATALQRSVLAAGVKEAVPDVDELKDDIAAMALEDGFPPAMVEEFKNSGIGAPHLVKGYAARVKMSKELAALQKENAELSQRLKDLPKTMLKKIDEAAKKKANLSRTPGDSGVSGTKHLGEDQIHNLSDEELSRELARLSKEG